MRFTLFEAGPLSPHDLIHVAKAAESCGFDNLAYNEGTFQMAHTRGIYPYSADHKPNWDLRAPYYDPMTLLPAVATHTERLRFYTSVLKLPLRHPLVLAKQIATAAVLTGDRFAVGVGASWAPEEYEFCGVDWHRRGRIMDESIEAMRLVLTGEFVEYHGEVIAFDRLVARPAPRRPVRFFVGGHHEPSLRRAARLADGWIAGPCTQDELAELITRLRQLVEEAGRDWASFEIHATPQGPAGLDVYRAYADLGVTDVGVLPINAGGEIVIDEPTRQRFTGQRITAAEDPDRLYSTAPPQLKLDTIARFAESVIARW